MVSFSFLSVAFSLESNNNTAFEYSRLLAKLEAIPGGISSGAALAASVEINESKKMHHKNTVVIIPSFAERYLSTALFSESDKSE